MKSVRKRNQVSMSVYNPIFMEGWQSLVECTGLENRQVSNGLVGSNPTPSAIFFS